MKRTIARQLLQIKAIKLSPQNPFTWASGWQSPIYCDNRKVLSYPNARNVVKAAMVQKSKEFEPFNMIAGVATAGIPHGALLADALGLPFVYVRSKPKGHGMQNLIEGDLRGNERILVIEDLISTGGSCLKAVEALEMHGCSIAGVMAIFTYGFDKAVNAFDEAGVRFETLSDYDSLIEEAMDLEYVSPNDLETLQEWRKNPSEWKKIDIRIV